jgi:four helix bundle protein
VQYDNTLIYQQAMELIDVVRVVTRGLPAGYAFLADQIRRAGSSVSLTFAEGYGKESAKDQRRFFMMARGSACEVAAALDVGYRLGVIDKDQHTQGRELCDHLARMLTRFRR